mgnify:CR=1 FL=1
MGHGLQDVHGARRVAVCARRKAALPRPRAVATGFATMRKITSFFPIGATAVIGITTAIPCAPRTHMKGTKETGKPARSARRIMRQRCTSGTERTSIILKNSPIRRPISRRTACGVNVLSGWVKTAMPIQTRDTNAIAAVQFRNNC